MNSWQSALFFESVEEIYTRVFRQLRPQLPLPRVEVSFQGFSSATSKIRFVNGTLRVQISDLLEKAPAPVQESLAFILLSKLFRENVPARMLNHYRLYLRRPEMQATIDTTRRARGAKRLSAPAGEHYDLDALFEQVNRDYFGGTLAKPTLGWSRTASRSILGHYDSAHHAIVLSKLLDQAEVPPFLVEYVMFHEMLHIKHPTALSGQGTGRRRVHTKAFREEEKTFPRMAEVKEALKKL